MLLEVDDLEVRYGRVPAVRDLSFSVGAGEIVSFIGPNGAGKSTTMLAVAGVLRPSKGRIRFDSRPINGSTIEAIATRGIAFVPEGRRIFSRMTVRENLAVAAGLRGGLRQSGDIFERTLALFPILSERYHSSAGLLSAGQQQQLAIARALLMQPRLLVVDEPSLGLAPKYVDLVFDVFRRVHSEGVTLLIVEQSIRRALQFADRLYVMRSGRIVLETSAVDLESGRDLERLYFGEEHWQ